MTGIDVSILISLLSLLQIETEDGNPISFCLYTTVYIQVRWTVTITIMKIIMITINFYLLVVINSKATKIAYSPLIDLYLMNSFQLHKKTNFARMVVSASSDLQSIVSRLTMIFICPIIFLISWYSFHFMISASLSYPPVIIIIIQSSKTKNKHHFNWTIFCHCHSWDFKFTEEEKQVKCHDYSAFDRKANVM